MKGHFAYIYFSGLVVGFLLLDLSVCACFGELLKTLVL